MLPRLTISDPDDARLVYEALEAFEGGDPEVIYTLRHLAYLEMRGIKA